MSENLIPIRPEDDEAVSLARGDRIFVIGIRRAGGGGSGGFLSADDPVVTTTVAADAPNSFALAGLATGLLKNTTSTGIPTIATAGTDYYAPGYPIAVADGGTGATSIPSAILKGVSDAIVAAVANTDYATPNGVQIEKYTYGTDAGSANAYVVAVTPAYGSLVAGATVQFIVANTNTGASTLNVSGLGAKAITKNGGTALSGGELTTGQLAQVVWDGTEWQLVSWPGTAGSGTIPSGILKGSGGSIVAATVDVDYVPPSSVQKQKYTYQATDTGSANAYVISLSPALASYTAGDVATFVAANANTGASTLNVNSLGTKAIKKNGTVALSGGEIVSGQVVVVVYDGTNWQLVSWPGSLGNAFSGAAVVQSSGSLGFTPSSLCIVSLFATPVSGGAAPAMWCFGFQIGLTGSFSVGSPNPSYSISGSSITISNIQAGGTLESNATMVVIG